MNNKTIFMILLSVQIFFAGCSETTFTIGGTISGTDRIFVVTLNGDEILEVDGSEEQFEFLTSLKEGEAYEVVVSDQPTSATCIVVNGTGTVPDGNVTDIKITCVEN